MATAIEELAGPWRFEDLPGREDLPDGYRYEVVDGHLLVTPPPAHLHQLAGARLLQQLAQQCPAEWLVVHDFGLRLGEDGRVPDLAVVTSTRPARPGPYPWGAEHFGLVVEVVSPGSRKTDLFAKPGEYAEAGIPLFWRVETEPDVLLHAFRLIGAAYVETATVVGAGQVQVPWGVATVDVSGLR